MQEENKHDKKDRDAMIMNILLIEDTSFAVTFIRETLAYCEESELIKSTKFALTNVETLGEGLKCVSEHKFDLILLDLNLPDSKELDTLDSVRENAHNIPIVVITALSDEGLALEAMKRGAEGFLVKGQMGVNALLQAIFFAVERHRILIRLEDKVRELERNKAKFQNIIQRITYAIIVVDRDGVVQFANNPSQYFLGTLPEDLIGENFEFPMEVGKMKEVEVKGKGDSKKMAEMRVMETEWEGYGAYLVVMRDLADDKE